LHELECRAIYYKHLSAALENQPEIAPSILIRRWSGLAAKLAVAKEALATTVVADFRRLADLEAAAEDCAKRHGGMPGFEPRRFDLPPLSGQSDTDEKDQALVWPATEKINQVLADFDWIRQVVQQAQERATWERTSRNRLNPLVAPGKAAGRRPD